LESRENGTRWRDREIRGVKEAYLSLIVPGLFGAIKLNREISYYRVEEK
jgi:hypothetical protein